MNDNSFNSLDSCLVHYFLFQFFLLVLGIAYSLIHCEFENCLFLLKNTLSKLLHVTVLCRITYLFISPDLWPPNSPDLNPVDYKIWGVMQQRVYQTKVQNVNDLKRRLINVWADMQQSSLTMQLTSAGSVCTPVFEPEEDSLSMHCDSRTILINAAHYCYHLIVKIYRLTRYLF